MDKYTVDLDKVLNDFEYSELTTEFTPCRTYVVPTSPTGSRAKCDSKHSITNVFHSLNEYLNSDITASSRISLETETATDEVDVEPGLTPNNVIDSNKEAIVPHRMPTYLNQQIAAETNTNDVQNDVLILPEVATVRSDDVYLLNLVEIVPSNVLGDGFEDPNVHARVTPILDVTGDDLNATDNKNGAQHVDTFVADDVPANTQDVIQISQENDRASDFEPEVLARNDEDEINPRTESESRDAETEKPVVIGFDNLIVNESDLHQYLGELEKEFENLHDPSEEDSSSKQIEENHLQVSQPTCDRGNSPQLDESRAQQISHSACDRISSSQLDENDPLQVPRSASDRENPPQFDDEAETPVQINSGVLDSVAESPPESSSGTGNERNASIAQSEVDAVQAPEPVEKSSVVSESLKSEEKSQPESAGANVKTEDIHDPDSVQRPTNLGLASEDTQLKREINLIGNLFCLLIVVGFV